MSVLDLVEATPRSRGRVTASALTTDRPTTEGISGQTSLPVQPTRPRGLGHEYTEKPLIFFVEERSMTAWHVPETLTSIFPIVPANLVFIG